MEPISNPILDRAGMKLPICVKNILKNGGITTYDAINMMGNTINSVVDAVDHNVEINRIFNAKLVKNEKERIDNERERIYNEDLRDNKEKMRELNEEGRVHNEAVRDKNEESRIEGEKERDKKISEFGSKIAYLTNKINALTGKFYGFYEREKDLPVADMDGFAYVGESSPYKIYNLRNGVWSDSGVVESGISLGSNVSLLNDSVPLADQMIEPFRTYIVMDDLSLDGSVIELPEGCALLFAGGSIGNGTIISTGGTIYGDIKGDAILGGFKNTGGKNIDPYSHKPIERELMGTMAFKYSSDWKNSIDNVIANAVETGRKIGISKFYVAIGAYRINTTNRTKYFDLIMGKCDPAIDKDGNSASEDEQRKNVNKHISEFVEYIATKLKQYGYTNIDIKFHLDWWTAQVYKNNEDAEKGILSNDVVEVWKNDFVIDYLYGSHENFLKYYKEFIIKVVSAFEDNGVSVGDVGMLNEMAKWISLNTEIGTINGIVDIANAIRELGKNSMCTGCVATNSAVKGAVDIFTLHYYGRYNFKDKSLSWSDYRFVHDNMESKFEEYLCDRSSTIGKRIDIISECGIRNAWVSMRQPAVMSDGTVKTILEKGGQLDSFEECKMDTTAVNIYYKSLFEVFKKNEIKKACIWFIDQLVVDKDTISIFNNYVYGDK